MLCALAVPPRGSGNLPAPVELRTRMLSAHSVRLHWVDPSLDHTQRIGDERYYNVYYHAVPHGKNLSVIVKALHVTLHDLEPGRRYRFKVRTVKGVNTSPFSDTITDRTMPGILALYIVIIKIIIIIYLFTKLIRVKIKYKLWCESTTNPAPVL